MKKSVLLETSARHAHLSRRVLDILFGEGYELTHKKTFPSPASLPRTSVSRSLAQRAVSPAYRFSARSARKPRSSSLLRTPVLSA